MLENATVDAGFVDEATEVGSDVGGQFASSRGCEPSGMMTRYCMHAASDGVCDFESRLIFSESAVHHASLHASTVEKIPVREI